MSGVNINFEQGSISFRIPAGRIDYNGNTSVQLFSHVSDLGTFTIIKKKDNGIQVNYNYFDKGVCCLEQDASILDNDDEHNILISWSLKEGKIILFIDEKKVKEEDIEKLF